MLTRHRKSGGVLRPVFVSGSLFLLSSAPHLCRESGYRYRGGKAPKGGGRAGPTLPGLSLCREQKEEGGLSWPMSPGPPQLYGQKDRAPEPQGTSGENLSEPLRWEVTCSRSPTEEIQSPDSHPGLFYRNDRELTQDCLRTRYTQPKGSGRLHPTEGCDRGLRKKQIHE